jgi:pimeloyl-ACP methyl ester carboxylesterase
VDELASFGGTSLGGVLAPLRVLTFWHMKRRARDVGAGGVADLLSRLQEAAPGARFHLMGHSFGCIVVSSAVAGRGPAGRRPVASLALVQGAMSLWSFASAIPSEPKRSGYFHRVLADGLVTGPVVVTTSVHDRAVRSFYPLGAGARGQVDYGPDRLPTYGAIGAFGVRGPGIEVVDDDLRAVDQPYDLRPGVVHDLRGDDVIRDSAGVMGAHSDITKPPVAHAVWQAALAVRAGG